MIAYSHPSPPPSNTHKLVSFSICRTRTVRRLHQKTTDYLSQSDGLTPSSQIGYPYRLPMLHVSAVRIHVRCPSLYTQPQPRGLLPALCALFPTAQAMQRSVSLQRAVLRPESERLQEYQKMGSTDHPTSHGITTTSVSDVRILTFWGRSLSDNSDYPHLRYNRSENIVEKPCSY